MEFYGEIKLDKEDSQHLYIQLYKALKTLILKDNIKGDQRLPPIRKLAKALSINVVTVVNAYDILEKEGFVYKKIGSGTYVSPQILGSKEKMIGVPEEEGFSLIDQGYIQVGENMINFASATPMPELFPVADFKAVLNEVLDRDKGYAFGYQESQGYYPLREILKKYIQSYGIDTEIDNIQVISGAQQGIDLIAKGILNYGDTVIVESPSYTGAIAAFRSRGAKIVDIALEEDGILLEELEKKIIIHRPKLIYIMPNFQNPTGISYSGEKKQKILEICRKYQVVVVEDDYLSELNFYSMNNQTLKAIDVHQQVIYIKSFSKIFMPGLRLGFLVIPSRFYDQLIVAKHSSDISTPGLLQRAFALYLEKGIWQGHLSYMEEQYKERFDCMVQSLKREMPKEVQCLLPKGGVNFWLTLPQGISPKKLYEEALKENIVFAPGHLFFLGKEDFGQLRLSIAAVSKDEIEVGIEKLGKIISKLLIKESKKKESFEHYKPIL
ncbi:putative transcriptional regulator, GntR family [Alkaliphilus metalliredigens QYMF]|uniref:Putative transcriptional regulator, GntR family n=1 Tax=Alkaliphilus metalliredigens (strain QYMF) TaxID=293826 RepID=A6TSX6_ALKMQ|nr:PLP-dependent aminotransferase family protein [Alkaliphilus metalliredigens]ABR49294.1 putative transcriptional regulator, GntR family [Alkaliphilus metalliredigens QYMF]